MSTSGPATPNSAPRADEPRDAVLAAAYRDAVDSPRAGSEPPAALDDAIRAAARRAVKAGPHRAGASDTRTSFRRWQAPLALAATLALAVGIAIKVYDSGEADVARPAKRASAPPPTTADTKSEAKLQTPATAADAAREKQAMQSAPATATAPRADASSAPAASGAATPATPPVKQGLEESRRRAEPPPPGAARGTPVQEASADGGGDAPRNQVPAAPAAAGRIAGAPKVEQELQRQERQAPVAPGPSVTAPAPPPPPPLAAARPAPEPPQAFPGQRESAPAGAAGAPRRAPAPPSAMGAPAAPPPMADARSPTDGLANQSEPLGARSSAARAEASDAGRDAPTVIAKARERVAPLAKQLEGRPPEAWVEEIRALRRAGQRSEADELLAELRWRFPEFTLPEDLR
jgi:hypothetical protein